MTIFSVSSPGSGGLVWPDCGFVTRRGGIKCRAGRWGGRKAIFFSVISKYHLISRL